MHLMHLIIYFVPNFDFKINALKHLSILKRT